MAWTKWDSDVVELETGGVEVATVVVVDHVVFVL